VAQSGNEGLRQPMAERSLGFEALALQAASALAGHFRRGAGFIDEDQPVWLKPHSGLALIDPFPARLTDVGAILFAGQQCFF
jgi:hypothetical protein